MTTKRNAMGAGTPAGQANTLIGGVSDNFAAAGNSQATATLLGFSSNYYVTTGTGGVILAPGNGTGDSFFAGDWQRVYNYSGSTITVYPPVGGKIANGTTNAGVSITNTKMGEFCSRDGGLNFGVNLSA